MLSTASEAMAERFRHAGFPEKDIYIGGPNDRKKKSGGAPAWIRQANKSVLRLGLPT